MTSLNGGLAVGKGQADERLPFVDAVLHADLARIEEIAGSTAPDDPYREVYLAIAESRRAQEQGMEGVRASFRVLSGLLEKPPADLELFQVLLIRVVALGCRSSNMAEAERALRLLEQLGGDREPRPDMQAAILYIRAVLLLNRGEAAASREAIERALEIVGPGLDRQRCVYKSLHIETAMHMGDWRTAEREWAQIEDAPFDRVVSIPWAYVHARVLSSAGKHADALAVLETAPAPSTAFEKRWILVQRMYLLFKLVRFDEARQLLEGPGASLSLFDRKTLELYAALLEGDLAAARANARQILTDPAVTPGMVRRAVGNMVELELASRRPKAARLLLESIDPNEENDQCGLAWARVHLLEGDEAGAAQLFRRFRDAAGADRLREELLAAHEMSAAQLARLETLAVRGPSEKPAAAAPAAGRGRPEQPRSGPPQPPKGGLVGESAAMVEVREKIERFAPLAETVLITGETGTGKELVARSLHETSPRSERPFLAVNCGAISDTLLESELFGHVRGAFTGAERAHQGLLIAAGSGTIFFDEIGSMSSRVQASLLRVLEERKVRPVGGTRALPVRCRVVAATNQPLEDLVKDGTFRQDLYYRLKRLEILLPPLRERIEDVPALARHFLQSYFDYGEVALGEDLVAELVRHNWPGNVRELRNAIERIALLAGGDQVLGVALFRSPAEAPDEPAEAETSPRVAGGAGASAPAARGARTRDRSERLRRLFRERRELSRGEAAGLLGCAPGTAAKELARLQDGGFIERVCPTRSARTHYFRLRASYS
jgi:DNA-binding NtrC family response regulator